MVVCIAPNVGICADVVGNSYFMDVIDWPLMCGYMWAVLLLIDSPVGWSSGCLCIVCVVW